MNLSQLNDIDVSAIPEAELDEYIHVLSNATESDVRDYVPYDKQLLFHTAKAQTRAIFGGNRSGKTVSATAEFVMHISNLYPSWYPEELKIPAPVKGRIIVADFAKGLVENVQPYINKFLPKHLIKETKKNHEGFIVKYVLHNGSSFDVCTHEQEQTAFEGWSGHLAWFDEPPPRDKYIATERGLVDFGGRTMLTLTPLTEPWLYDEIVCKQSDDIFVLTVDTYDNPHLSKEYIQKFEAKLTPEEKEARIHGKFLHLTGLIYKVLNRKVHEINLDLMNKDSVFNKSPKSWYFILDPHDNREHCAIWAYVSPNKKKYVAYELFQDLNLTDLVGYILAFEKSHNIPTDRVVRLGDPRKLATPETKSRLTLNQEFVKINPKMFFHTKIDTDILSGHTVVRNALSYIVDKPINTFNSPSLYFNSYSVIPHTWQMLQKYVYDEWRGATKDSKNPKEKPRELNKDFPDCIRYFLMFNPGFVSSDQSYLEQRNVRTDSVTGYR